MKKLITILFLLVNSQLFATNYYVNTDGSGDYTTIAQINAASFSAGDSIFFNKGDVWRETLEVPDGGSSSAYLYFGTYGTGDNPRILGSKATTTWTDQGSNVWKTTITFTDPRSPAYYYADITFNESGTETFGDHVTSTGNLANKYDWFYSGSYIYVYSTTNPASAYTGIEVPQRRFGISTNNEEYLHFNGIDIFYACGEGMDTNNDHGEYIDIDGCIIENAEIGFIGGVSDEQYGFGIATPMNDLIIRNCEIHHCGRRGISFNLQDGGTP